MYSFQELDTLLNAWRIVRNLIDPAAQYLRFVEEVGELVTAVRKEDQAAIADEFGDVIVTLMVHNQMTRMLDDEGLWQWLELKKRMRTPDFSASFAEALGDLIKEDVSMTIQCEQSVAIGIVEIGLHLNLDPLTCLNAAYQKIAHRQGQTIPGKGFVKASDL